MFEELSGAKDYLRQAMSLKDTAPEWAKTFNEMASTEMDHSRTLYRMFNEHYKQINTNPDLSSYMEPFKQSVDEAYIEKVGMIKYMQDVYNKQ
jgi:rubrerythrin